MGFLFKRSNSTTRADRISSFQATTCDFGTPVPLLYGTSKIAPNLIKYDNFRAVERRTTTKSGKSKSTQIDYEYYADIQLALGEGAIDSIGAVWVGDVKYSSLYALTINQDGGSSGWSINLGDVDNPVYGKLAYVEGNIFLGTNSASMPSYNMETRGRLRSTGDGTDANPAHIIKDMLAMIGLDNYIDTVSFNNYAEFCKEADLLVSTPAGAFTEQKKAQEVIKDLLTLTNTFMFWSVDRFKFVPREPISYGTWRPNTTITYDINHDDLIPQNGAPLTFKRKSAANIYNYITVNFTNRANDYEEEGVSYQDVADITERGTVSQTVDAKWFHTKERAVRYAKMLARQALTETNQYTLVLDWAFNRLEAGDLLRVTDSAVGLENQIMMVSEVVESTAGIITVTAVSRPAGDYSDAAYTVRDDYQYIDYNVEAGDTDDPLFIIPPADLVTSANGVEIWIALRGKTDKWGGCDVYASNDDSAYEYIGTQEVSSYYGKLTAPISPSDNTMIVHFDNVKEVTLLTGEQDPLAGKTDVWINGEVIAYAEARKTAPNTWELTGLQRGRYGTTPATHATNEAFACLDGGLYVVPLTKYYLGKTLYFKFPAMNYLRTNKQDLTPLDFYTCNVNTADLPDCTGVTAYNKYRELADDVTRYDVVVEWTPANFASYKQAQVWYKTSNEQSAFMGVISEGVPSDQLGTLGRWIYGGQGYDTVTIPQAVIGDTYTIAVCTEDIYNNVESPDMSPQTQIFIGLRSETPNTPNGASVFIDSDFNIVWDEVRNADVKYYEVRTNNGFGHESGLIARVTETQLKTNIISSRTGTIYIYAVSAYGKASAPAVVQYNFPTPPMPTITCESKLAGIQCVVSAIPNSCNGVHWFLDGTDSTNDVKTEGATYFYSANAGVYEISACYTDYFGDGTRTAGEIVSITAYIDDSLIKSESITLEKLSADAQKAIEEGGLDTVNIAVRGMLGEGSALVLQPDGNLALVASNGEILTGMFVNQDGVIRLQGKYTHITGGTRVDGSVITNNMLAGGITADKMNVSSLSAITANIGTLRTRSSGARVEISDNLIQVFDNNDTLRVKMGVW